MLARCPHSPQRGTGWLEGWRLTFGGEDIGWDGALTTVVEDPAQRVFLVLYDVPEIDERELDTWDGVTLGYYRKLKVRVQTLDGDVLAWLYVLDAYEGGLPSARHVSILVDAAIKAGAPDDYVQWLQSRPCNPPSVTPGPMLEIPDEPPTFLSAFPIRLTPSSKSSASSESGDQQGRGGEDDGRHRRPMPARGRRLHAVGLCSLGLCSLGQRHHHALRAHAEGTGAASGTRPGSAWSGSRGTAPLGRGRPPRGPQAGGSRDRVAGAPGGAIPRGGLVAPGRMHRPGMDDPLSGRPLAADPE